MSETQAPLAETDLTQHVGLTLEDLSRLHGEPASDETALELDTESTQITEEMAAEASVQTPEALLKAALQLELDGEIFQLDQSDDLQYFAKTGSHLLNKSLPELMQRLGRQLYAREQTHLLYERLSELSQQRGAAADIIQLAKQIETLEKQQQTEQISIHERAQVLADLNQVTQILQRYQEVMEHLEALPEASPR